MKWERLAIVYAILVPTVALMVLLSLMAIEADYTEFTRFLYFGGGG
jgi:cytochrome c oxidase subunit IV